MTSVIVGTAVVNARNNNETSHDTAAPSAVDFTAVPVGSAERPADRFVGTGSAREKKAWVANELEDGTVVLPSTTNLPWAGKRFEFDNRNKQGEGWKSDRRVPLVVPGRRCEPTTDGKDIDCEAEQTHPDL